ncbi:MAG: response regulator [Opitutaceae bacterium]
MKLNPEPSPQNNQAFYKRVMVIDDSLTVRKVVSKSLAESGHEVVECCTGEEGLRELNTRCYDLIFLDYILPDTVAADFLNQLLTNTSYAQVPVVLMSSKGAEIEKLSAVQGNVAKTLTKPFSQDAVKSTCSTLLNGDSLHGTGLTRNPFNTSNTVKANSISPVKVLLEKGLSRVATHLPALEAKRNDQDARRYFLPFLMHPDLIRSLEKLEQSSTEIEANHQLPAQSGQFSSSATYEVIHNLVGKNLSGRLQIEAPSFAIEIYVHKGRVTGVSTRDFLAYSSALADDTLNPSEDEVERLKQQQKKTGVPFILESGEHQRSTDQLTDTLRSASENLLSKLLSTPCVYHFWSEEVAPDWTIEHTINIGLCELFLGSLRRIHGWGIISREIGDLVTRFCHRYTVGTEWLPAYLTSFEAVVYDFLRFDYSVSELASTLGEAPSRVAEAIHTLHRIGVIIKSGQPKPEQLIESIVTSSILLMTTDDHLEKKIRTFGKRHEITVDSCSQNDTALRMILDKAYTLIITDGSSTDGTSFDVIKKLKKKQRDIVWLLAEGKDLSTVSRKAVKLQAYDFLPIDLSAKNSDNIISKALTYAETAGFEIDEASHELKSINARLAAQQKLLNQRELELQTREHELLRNEEVFFEKCNHFEEERARLDIMQDNFSNS